MNSMYPTTKTFIASSLFVVSLLCHSLYGMMVNDKPLNSIMKPDEILAYTLHNNKDNFVLFQIKNGKITLNDGHVNDLPNVQTIFEEISKKNSGCIRSKVCHLSSNSMDYNGSYLAGLEKMNIEARALLNLVHTRLESPEISITGNQMNFGDCFLINPHNLYIFSNSPESDIKSIHIIFHEQSENPTVMTGNLDLKNNQTNGRLILSNVKQMKIQFDQKVWKN